MEIKNSNLEEFKLYVYKQTLLAGGVEMDLIDKILKTGSFICPACYRVYRPKYRTKDEAFKTTDLEAREQWLSHICSTRCWDAIFK